MARSRTGVGGTSVDSQEERTRPRSDFRWWWLLWAWAPVALWLVVIAVTSGDVGAHTHADVWIWRVLHEWLPGLLGFEPSAGTPSFLPSWIRKLAHVTEYAVLGLLTARAWWLRQGRGGAAGARGRPPGAGGPAAPLGIEPGGRAGGRGMSPVAAGWVGPSAMAAFCVGVAIIDELHQSTLPSRTGSPRDVLVDALGAAVGVGVGTLVWRRRHAGPGLVSHEDG